MCIRASLLLSCVMSVLLLFPFKLMIWADPEGTGDSDLPEKSQKYRVSLQYWSGSPENHKATKPAFNVGPSSARQQNAISMAFCWRTDDGPFIAFLSSIPLSLKKLSNF